MPAAQWDPFRDYLDDPLVNTMLPIPRNPGDRGFLIADPRDALLPLLMTLSRLCPPVTPTIMPLWMLTDGAIRKDLGHTNLQPLVLTQIRDGDQKRLNSLVKGVAYTPRTVILTGSSSLVLTPGLKRLETGLGPGDVTHLQSLPLEHIGAEVLRRYLRKEEIT